MRLGLIFVTTLAVSVLLGSAGTWAVTFSTSYRELQDLAGGFVRLTTVAGQDFGQLVSQLIGASEALVASILDTVHAQSAAQFDQVGRQFTQTTAELTVQADNQSQLDTGLVRSISLSFGSLMTVALSDFRGVATTNAYRLRVETAVRVQSLFYRNVQNRILAIQRQARLFQLGFLNVSRTPEVPQDDGAYTLLASICAGSAELNGLLYAGTATGVHISCTPTFSGVLNVQRGSTGDYFWYSRCFSNSNYTVWRQACMQSNATGRAGPCAPGTNSYPLNCNETCGYDPRCRLWYVVFNDGATGTQMSGLYNDQVSKNAVITLSHPTYSGDRLVLVTASDFSFNDIDTLLRRMGINASQFAAVVFNNSDLIVVGTNRNCPNATLKVSGQSILQSCDPALRALGDWLAAHRAPPGNVSLELAGTLWEVFPGAVEGVFAYFVVVGMNRSAVYAYLDAATQAANSSLRAIAQQHTSWLSSIVAAFLSALRSMATAQSDVLQAKQAELGKHSQETHNVTAQQFIVSRQFTAYNLAQLMDSEMAAVDQMQSKHFSHIMANVGVTFAAVVGIFAAVLLAGAYSVGAVAKQFDRLMRVMENVVDMRVEELEVAQNSFICEVHRIEVALCILVCRLAEYKSYMPAGLFQPGGKPEPGEPTLAALLGTADAPPTPKPRSPGPRAASFVSHSTASHSAAVSVAGTPSRMTVDSRHMRLMRRSIAAMAVNIIRFQGEVAQRSASQLEAMLNHFITTVHSAASKAQGNIDAVVGDQLLVTFNAHFTCSDPPTAASTVALELRAALKEDSPQCGQVQIGLAAGSAYAGHVGYGAFKSMLAVGAPLKVASLLAHLSGFPHPAVLTCPAVEERTKYHFTLQPVDLVALPGLGEHISLYSRSICVYLLEEGHNSHSRPTQEWLYEVTDNDSRGQWALIFSQVAKAETIDVATERLRRYLQQHSDDQLAQRLLGRLPAWQPRAGLVLAERPDVARDVPAASPRGSPTLQPTSPLSAPADERPHPPIPVS